MPAWITLLSFIRIVSLRVFPVSAVLYSCTCRLIEERNDFHDFPLGAMKSAGVIEMPVTRVYPLFTLQSAMLFI